MIVFCPTEFPLCSIGQSCGYFDILFHSNLWLFFKSRNHLKLPSYCMLYCSLLKSATVTQLGDRELNRTNVPNKSTPSVPTQSMKGCTTPPRSMPPTFYEQQCGFFYVPKESEQWKLTCKTGPTGFCPYIYLRRLEWLTTCRCHNKGSTLSGRGLNPRPPTWQTGTYPIELTRWRLIMIELLLNSSCRVSMLQTASYNKNDSLSFKVPQ